MHNADPTRVQASAAPSLANPPRMQEIRPAAFTAYRQFILWKLVPRGDRLEKIPCNERGFAINAHDPAVWLSAADALRLHHTTGYGIGFVLTANDPFWCADADYAAIGGRWSQLAERLFATFPGAAYEVSFSGQGLHIFGTAVPMPAHRSVATVDGEKLELYSEGRFIALTGHGAGGDAATDHTAALTAFVAAVGLLPDPAAPDVGAVDDTGPCEGWTGYTDDDKLIEHMLASKRSAAAAFAGKAHPADLWNRNVEALARAFPEESERRFGHNEADAALMWHLAYWTGKDRARMHRLFARSPLYRAEKYEGKGTYRLNLASAHGISKQPRFYNRPREMLAGTPQYVNGAVVLPSAPARAPPAPGSRDFLKLMNLNQIMATHYPKPEFVVDTLFAPGVYLLIGKPKKGKSWLCMDIGLNVATGGHVFGFQCTQGRVLYFALEDYKRRIHERMIELMPRNMTLGSDVFMCATIEDKIENMDRGFVESLRSTLQRADDVRLVMIDVLSKVRPGKRPGEGPYDYDRRCIDPFVDLCAEFPKLCVIIVHHARKSGSDDVYDLASGTLGLTGATDGNFILGYDVENQTTVLHGTGRDIEPFEQAVKFNPPKWELLGDPGEVGITDNQRKIISVIDRPLTMTEITVLTGILKPTVQKALATMCKQGKLRKNGKTYDIYNG